MFHAVLPFTAISQREARPSRVSVSSYRIGNLASGVTWEAPPASCNKPHRPFVLWWTGSRLEKEVTVHLTAEQATSQYSGSPAASISIFPYGVISLPPTKVLYEPTVGILSGLSVNLSEPAC
jgi:hypothetical protein